MRLVAAAACSVEVKMIVVIIFNVFLIPDVALFLCVQLEKRQGLYHNLQIFGANCCVILFLLEEVLVLH